MSELQLLPTGPFTRQQAEAVTSRYQNISIEDDQRSHFHRWFVTLKVEWSGGRGVLNRMPVKDLTIYIRQYGILRASSC